MTKEELTNLVQALNTTTSLSGIDISWEGDAFRIESNDRTILSIVFLFITQCAMHCIVGWERDKDTYRNYLKGWIL